MYNFRRAMHILAVSWTAILCLNSAASAYRCDKIFDTYKEAREQAEKDYDMCEKEHVSLCGCFMWGEKSGKIVGSGYYVEECVVWSSDSSTCLTYTCPNDKSHERRGNAGYCYEAACSKKDDPCCGDPCCDDPDQCCDQEGYAADPVSLRTGAEVFTRTDLIIGKLYPITIERKYNSMTVYDSPVGFGWGLNYDKRLYTYPDNSITLRKECGQKMMFEFLSGYQSPVGESGTLTANPDGSHVFTDKFNRKELYDIYGRLEALVDENGNSLVFSYELVETDPIQRKSLTGLLPSNVNQATTSEVAYDYRLMKIQEKDASGALTGIWVKLTYDTDENSETSGRLMSLLDNSGRTVTYSHDTVGNLTQVVSPFGTSTYDYVPETRHLLTRLNEGQDVIENEYDDLGRVKIQKQGTGISEFTYDPVTKEASVTTTIADRNNVVLNKSTREITFGTQSKVVKEKDGKGNQTVLERDEAGRLVYEERWGQTANGKKLEKVEYNEFDPVGNLILKSEAIGTDLEKTTTYEFDPTTGKIRREQQPSIVVSGEMKYTYYASWYDEMGRLDYETITESGLLSGGTRYNYITTKSYAYINDVDNIVITMSVDGPRDDVNDVTVYTYYTTAPNTGRIRSISRPGVGATSYGTYDERGNPRTVTDPNGAVTTYAYDDQDRVTKILAPGDDEDHATLIVYNIAGCASCSEVRKSVLDYIKLPGGERIDFGYDPYRNLETIKDSAGNVIKYTYDSAGNIIKEEIKDPLGTLQMEVSTQYDALNQPSISHKTDSTTSFSHNSRGQVTSSVISDNSGGTIITEEFTYDIRGRKINGVKITENGTVTTTYEYNLNNDLIAVIDANGRKTQYGYDDRGVVTYVSSPDTGVTNYGYDEAKNLKWKKDAQNTIISYSYDAVNRLTGMYSAAMGGLPEYVVAYVYDYCSFEGNTKGRLCRMSDASGTTTYTYSPKGQVLNEVKTINGSEYSTAYSYDWNGNIASITYPSGRRIIYTYANTRITGVWYNGAPLASNITYKPFGGMTSINFGNGISSVIGYDMEYQLTSINTSAVQNLSYSYSSMGNITHIKNLTESARTRSFTYDAFDQLRSATSGLWGTLRWEYDKVGNRTKEIHGSMQNTYNYTAGKNRLESISGAASTAFSYDTNGNTAYENSRQFVYNQNQRLIRVVEGTATLGEYVYNGFGQRVKKTAGGVTTVFHYNLQGLLIAESGGSNADYVYLNGHPLAKIQSGAVYYYHNDHLGTPQKLTDSTGTVVWSADYKPFGEATITVSTITNNLRFPGQYFDAETGSHYNYFRDYDPAIGKYKQADPIGILGGDNHLFVYVKNNPVNYSDRFGLVVLVDDATILAMVGIMAGVAYLESPAGQQAIKNAIQDVKDLIQKIEEENKKKLQQCKNEVKQPSPPPGDPNKIPEDPETKWKFILAKLIQLASKFIHP